MTVVRPSDERPYFGIFRFAIDREKRKLYVRPDYFQNLQDMATAVDQQPWIDEQHALRARFGVPEGTEIAVEVVYD